MGFLTVSFTIFQQRFIPFTYHSDSPVSLYSAELHSDSPASLYSAELPYFLNRGSSKVYDVNMWLREFERRMPALLVPLWLKKLFNVFIVVLTNDFVSYIFVFLQLQIKISIL